MDYRPDEQSISFVLMDVLHADRQLAQLQAFAEHDADLMRHVLQEAAVFVGEKIAPLQRAGDEQGARFSQGRVTSPAGFAAAYQDFWRSGWGGLSSAVSDGGQGLPELLNQVLYEWLSAANHAWTMAPGLLHGAYECLKHHAPPQVQAQFLPKLATGEWLATMCLTEPHAGSDLGQVRTRATPLADGRYALEGTKIFISGGEHDLSENIVHLVLARLPDAPPGPKGLSLFVVPKFYSDGGRSAVVCERIEEKMGLHGSATCVMRFDGAAAWLVGEAGRGLQAMFVMMNAARLHVALQGIGLLDAAWQKAHAYANERRQMRAPGAAGASAPPAGGSLIIEHPAVQRMLDVQRVWIDGMRVVAYQTAIELDMARHHPDEKRRAQAQLWCGLLTPVLKAACTDQAFDGASACLQVFGGHGYVREWGVEQILRDARITKIYEGTNEIQAIDLLVRKIAADEGLGMSALLALFAQDARLPQAAALESITARLLAASRISPTLLPTAATDYLRCVALLSLQWAWQRIEVALPPDDPAHRSECERLHRALQAWVEPEFQMRLTMLEAALNDAPANAAPMPRTERSVA
jgi:alkylation response protein AidB-like acyl-CoA dehydrogenase